MNPRGSFVQALLVILFPNVFAQPFPPAFVFAVEFYRISTGYATMKTRKSCGQRLCLQRNKVTYVTES